MEDKTLESLGKYLDKDFRVLPMALNKATGNDINEIKEKRYDVLI